MSKHSTAPQNLSYASLPPVSLTYLQDFESRVQVLGGSVGTGKTFVQGLKLLVAASTIKPSPDGVRRSRWIVARKRYGDLEGSIAADMEQLIAPGLFHLTGKKSPMFGTIDFTDGDGVKVFAEIYFYAFETIEDASKIKSMKFTGAFLVEAQEFVSPKIIKRVFDRTLRYPTPANVDDLDEADLEHNSAIAFIRKDGTELRGFRMSLDINFPDTTHWLKEYMEDGNFVDSRGEPLRRIFRQPPTHLWMPNQTINNDDPLNTLKGVEGRFRGETGAFVRNPEALPYIKHNGWGYWEDIIRESMGDDTAIQQDILAEFGSHVRGKPVHPKFSRDAHVSTRPLAFTPGIPVHVGVDNGFNNAWVFSQQMPGNVLHVIAEIENVGDNAKTVNQAIKDDVLPFIADKLIHNDTIIFVLDQAFYVSEGGRGTKQVELFNEHGLMAIPCPIKFATPIRDITDDALARHQIVISPECPRLINALTGGHHFPINKATGGFKEDPDKSPGGYSHIAEAFEFICVQVFKPKGGNKKQSRHKHKRKEYRYL